ESTSINGATAYVNKASGLLTLNCDLASVNNSSYLPLQASLVYNSSYNDIFTELGVPNMFGNDFKLNFQQYVKVVTNQYITLYDADGSVTILNYDSDWDIYRTIDGKLSALISGNTITVFDVLLNARVFESGRLKRIFNGSVSSDVNYNGQRIEVVYDTTNTNKITNILYYDKIPNMLSSKISFTYSGDKVSSVTTYFGTTAMMTYTLTYDSSSYLTNIRNTSAGVDTFKLEYDTDGYLESVFNHYKEGLCFTRLQYEERIWKINQLQGQNSNNAKWLDYIEFDYGDYYYLTKTYHYENGRNVSTGYTMFDVALNPISEWVEDRNGDITGINKGYHNFTYTQNAYLPNYTRENVAFEEKLNTTFSGTISLTTGQSTSGNVNSSSGITYNSYYKYGLTFLAESAYDMDLTVTFASVSKRIVLENGGKLYITLPTTYVQSGTFTFKNNSSLNPTKISNVTYNVIDYVKETTAYETEPGNHEAYYTKELLSYTNKGEYEKRSYDANQLLISIETRSKEDTTLETTTYSYNENNVLTSVITKRNGTTIYSETHSDSGNTNPYITTVDIIKNGENLKSIQTTKEVLNGATSYTITTRDSNNPQTVQNYAILSGDVRLESVVSNGIKEKYTYDNLGNIITITLIDSLNNTILSSTNNYTNGVNTGHTFGDNTYTRTYDSLGYVTTINHNGSNMLSYNYVDDTRYSYDNYLDSITYSNDQIEMYTYNGNSTIVDYVKNSAVSDTYTYNNDNVNRLTSSNHSKNGVELLNYNYGDLNDTEQRTLTVTGLSYGAQLTTNFDDVQERVTSTSNVFTRGSINTTYNVSYGYNGKGQITNNSVGSYSSNVLYDGIDRISRYTAKNSSTSILDRTYIYDTWSDNSGSYATNRLKLIRNTSNNNAVAQSVYDTKGYITSVQYNGKTYNYTYDDVGRLASESINGTTKTYSYNSNSAITSISAGSNTDVYTYNTNGRLIEYTENNDSYYFRYDAMGNPVMYKGMNEDASSNMVWSQGRKLESGTLNNNTFSYAYDMNGLRYKKTVNGNVTEYYLDGSKIIAENRKSGTSNNLIYYIYDMVGLSGFVYNGANYYYEKNTLGDIIGIRDSSGTQVATYTYDAWGNILTKTGSMADINPFRYRGYYYDTETGFYYLQTRYYDPTIRRFINADNYELLPTLSQTIGQLNLYAYANNNPIMFTDESGTLAEWTVVIIAMVVGAILGGIAGGFTAAYNGVEGWGIIGGVLNGAFIGAVSGAFLIATGSAMAGGVGYALNLGVNMEFMIRTFAIGMLVSNTLGPIIGYFAQVDWPVIEWGKGK
ncbi:MAG: RHS repeat-associated core domain-containing protein, partial [Clostridia bacterium]|nr:RHS repeat-associated core domain-containing protein [Clostridia bacterium]